MKRGNATYRGYKAGLWQTERKEQLHPIRDKDRTNHNTKMQPDRHIHLNWLNFKPEFSGKPDKDAEAYLLDSNDWMKSHHFDEDIKVQRFCLTLLGEARLWYHFLEPLGNTTWPQLHNLFRQRYSKLGNTCEQLFHACRSFTFDENTETIDSFVIRIRQVATLLCYGEPQILEVFKNTLPTKLYWILFPIEDLRQAVEMAKRILTKEKLDKQLTSQTSTSPFMSVRDRTDRRVSFDTREELGDKIDKLTAMMSKLAAKDSYERKPFTPQIYKSRGQNRSYGQGGYQTKSDRENRGHIMNNSPRQNYRSNNFRGTARGYGRQNNRENERYSSKNRDRNRSRCARAQSISQHVDAGQLNVPPQQQPITLSLTKVMLD